jgi:hypothetical protein
MSAELDTISFPDLLHKSVEYLADQQEICKAKYKLESYTDWFAEQETGELAFFNDGVKKLIINYECVGSVSIKTNTWLWAWANKSILDEVKSDLKIVRSYGQKRQFDHLMFEQWLGTEVDGWQMTSIAAYLMKAKGAYRVPTTADGLLYMIFKEINWVK